MINLIFNQLTLVLLHGFVMLPLWNLGDELRQKPLREVSKQIITSRYTNEQIAMVGIRKPSIHFYTGELIKYELNDPRSLAYIDQPVAYTIFYLSKISKILEKK